MPEVTSHTPGMFSWAELATSDATGAKHFYTALFGWTFEDSPIGGGMFYTRFPTSRSTTATRASSRPAPWVGRSWRRPPTSPTSAASPILADSQGAVFAILKMAYVAS